MVSQMTAMITIKTQKEPEMRSKPRMNQLKQLTNTIKTTLQNTSRRRIEDTRKFKNWRFLAYGASRFVFRDKSNKFVLKIETESSLRDETYQQNKGEIETYKTIPDHLKKHFLEPLAHAEDYSWIVQKRVKNYKDLDGEEISKILKDLEELLAKEGFRVYDLHSSNIGMDENGNGVILDYGLQKWSKYDE